MVTLEYPMLVHADIFCVYSFVREGHSQCADAKHHGHANLLLPVQLERSKLPERNRHDPDIDSNTHTSIRPADTIGIKTGSLMHAIPLGPEVRDGPALENSRSNKRHAPSRHEEKGPPQQPLNALAGKDAHEEGDER